jgi:hypothetical protein
LRSISTTGFFTVPKTMFMMSRMIFSFDSLFRFYLRLLVKIDISDFKISSGFAETMHSLSLST